MTNMKDVNDEPSLTQCNPESGLTNSKNIDPVPDNCAGGPIPSQKKVDTEPDRAWRKPPSKKKLGVGQQGNCDPLMTGQIINDGDSPSRDVIYRYSKALRGADEAMLDLFRNLVILDEDGKSHPVPIIWGTQEKAVASVLQDNVRKDNGLVVDRIRLPMMSIINSGMAMDLNRFSYQKNQSFVNVNPSLAFAGKEQYENDTIYGVTRGIPVDRSYTLYIWTLYQEDMNQILEQCWLKFSPVAYIRVQGVPWGEIIVTLDGEADNLELEPGDVKLRVFKCQLTMTAKTYIPQPITRYKLNGLDPASGIPEDLKDVIKKSEDIYS